MDKESFIEILARLSPNEVREFLIKKGKRKLICPFIFDEDYQKEETKINKSN